MRIKCSDHQWVEWEGHVVCSACRRVYQTKDSGLPHFAPMMCACGTKLMPDRNNGKRKFSARSCCPQCFERHAAVQLVH